MYTGFNFKTKEDLVKAIKAGKKVTVFQSKIVGHYTHRGVPTDGQVTIQGPWVTKDNKHHDWFAEAVIKDGRIVEVLS